MNALLSAAQPEFYDEWWRQILPSKNELGLVLAAAGIITLLALIWAIFIRKREDETSRCYSYPHLGNMPTDGASKHSTLFPQRKRRRKRRRRHRRNPTLAETGGLPPIRSEGMPDDPP